MKNAKYLHEFPPARCDAGRMEFVILTIGATALANCALGLVKGKMYFFFKAPDEFIGAVRTIERSSVPAFFWIFFAVTLAFGIFMIRFAQTNF